MYIKDLQIIKNKYNQKINFNNAYIIITDKRNEYNFFIYYDELDKKFFNIFNEFEVYNIDLYADNGLNIVITVKGKSKNLFYAIKQYKLG